MGTPSLVGRLVNGLAFERALLDDEVIGRVRDTGQRRPASSLARLWAGPWLGAALVIVLFCFPLFVNLGGSDLENDEAGHSFAVDVMLKTGDWLTPRSSPREDVAFLEKPPLKFWLVAAPIRLGLLPHDEFGLRFWDAVFGSALFLYVFAIGRMVRGPLAGVAAVLMLFVQTPLLVDHGLRSNNMEAMVVLAYCAGFYHYFAWRRAENPRRRGLHIVAGTLYFAAAFMMKTVAAAFLPALVGVAIVARRDDRARIRADWRACAVAAALAGVLIAPWFLYQYHRFGSELWSTMFGMHVYKRLTAYLDPAHLQPWHFYFSTILSQLRTHLVLTPVLGGAALIAIRTIRTGWQEGAVILAWMVLPVALISLGSSKLYHYAYPCLPPLAIAGGYLAAVLARFFLRSLDRWLVPLDRVLGASVRRVVAWPAVRVAFLAVAAASLAVAVATGIEGTFRLTAGDRVLLRSSSMARPLLFAVVAFCLSYGRLASLKWAAVAVALWVWLLPIAPYKETRAALAVEEQRLRSLRACLQPVADRFGDPGVYVDDKALSHSLFYYLRGLGPFVEAHGAPDSPLYAAMYVPSRLQPALVSDARLDTFLQAVRADGPNLAAIAARRARADPAVVRANAANMPVAFVRFAYGVLMLPGPYSDCGFAVGKRHR